MSSRFRGIARWACAALLIAVGAVGCNKGPAGGGQGSTDTSASVTQRRIILLTNGNSPFWDAARAGLQEAQKELKLADVGIKAVLEVNNGKIGGQISKLRQFGSQGDIAGVAISAINANNVAVAEEMRNLRKRGVHVITFDSDVDVERSGDARQFYIGTDNVLGGRMLGITAKNLRPEGGDYVQFVGKTGAQNAIERMNGFKEAAGDAFTERDRMGDEFDLTRARDNVRNALKNFPEIGTLVGIWSYNAPAIVDIVKETNRPDITVVTFDAEKLAIDHMAEGHIDAMVVQNPYDMGYRTVRLLKAMIEDDQATISEMFPNQGQEGGDIHDTGLRVVVPDEGSPLKKEMFDPAVEFMTLSEFKAWLAKYGLTSS